MQHLPPVAELLPELHTFLVAWSFAFPKLATIGLDVIGLMVAGRPTFSGLYPIEETNFGFLFQEEFWASKWRHLFLLVSNELCCFVNSWEVYSKATSYWGQELDRDQDAEWEIIQPHGCAFPCPWQELGSTEHWCRRRVGKGQGPCNGVWLLPFLCVLLCLDCWLTDVLVLQCNKRHLNSRNVFRNVAIQLLHLS